MEKDKIITLETEYEVVDEWKSSVQKCIVTNEHSTAKPEARLYFGSDKIFFSEFFCDDIEKNEFIFLKKDFNTYMIDAKDEFLNPLDSNIDKSKMLENYQYALSTIEELENIKKFKMKLQKVDNQGRIFINVDGESEYYNLLRKIAIPKKSYLSILKLKNEEKILYYFRLIMENPYETRNFEKFDRNKIFFGAPGTGKSFQLNRERKELIFNENDYERVTFHPDYSYAQFVGSYRPVPDVDEEGKKTISYEYVPGPFMRILSKAIENTRSSYRRPFLLVIEEINRANMAAVFGDVFQLLDRDKDNSSQYSINLSEEMKDYFKKIRYDLDTIKIPSNMFIWATMNSADQGVFPMDTAFKRRWNFEYIDIDNEQGEIEDISFNVNGKEINWNNLRKSINNFLLKNNINEDKLLGPFFVSNIQEFKKDSSKDFKETFKSKVLMYLYEDAAKSIKYTVFDSIPKQNLSYSMICTKFDSKGIGIFNKEIKDFYEKLNNNE